jgi:hypothetical protein
MNFNYKVIGYSVLLNKNWVLNTHKLLHPVRDRNIFYTPPLLYIEDFLKVLL